MNIDWSKAPEDATHFTPKFSGNTRPCFWRVENGKAVEVWAVSDDFLTVCDHFKYGPNGCPAYFCHKSVSRPFVWTGGGLPPIGTVCEFTGGEDYPYEQYDPDLKKGARVTIIAHFQSNGIDIAAFTFSPNSPNRGGLAVQQAMHGCFRPIRTDREKVVDAWLEEIAQAYGAPVSDKCADILASAGYRKQVTS